MRALRYAFALTVIGCAPEPVPSTWGAVARLVDAAATEANVPAELVMAIAVEEGGIRLPAIRAVRSDAHVPIAGLFELRHGRLDTLALGASLVGRTELELRVDTELATRAGARVLALLAAKHHAGASLASWRPALEELSGMDDANAHDYASRVLALLRTGGEHAARDGELVRLAAHAEISEADTAQSAAVSTPPADGYPGAIQFATSCTNKCTVGRPLGMDAVDKIVIHDTEGGWDGSVATLQYDSGKSVHYIVDADGSRVGQFRPETDTTWHAGNFFYNETSVGIEHVGDTSDPAGYAAELYATSRALVADIRTRWNVPLDRTHIIGHYQVPNEKLIANDALPCTDKLDACEHDDNYGGVDNHRDPGEYWQWCQYMEKLGGYCTCNDAWDHWNCTTDKTEAVRCFDGAPQIEACPDGCVVQAVGSDDVCNGAAVGVDAGTGDDAGGSAETDPGHRGGCSSSGAGSLLLALALLSVPRGRRRSPTARR
jgi:N-acetyl-anhydromuramyl-L-alanine amidase AmpD